MPEHEQKSRRVGRAGSASSTPTGVPRVSTGHAHALDLQRQVGNRSAQALLPTDTSSDALRSSTVLRRLRRLPIIKAHLSKMLAQGTTIETNIERQLDTFDQHLARRSAPGQTINEAIRIATVVDGVAAELARSIGDPTLKGRIAQEFVAAHRRSIERKLASKDKDADKAARSAGAVGLAAAMVGDDPVTLYMQGKIPAEDAAWRIRDMADPVTLLPGEMFDILEQRFQMAMGSYTPEEIYAGKLDNDQIHQTDDSGTEKLGTAGFDLADLVGEISPNFHREIIGSAAHLPENRASMPGWGSDGLAITDAAARKLSTLAGLVRSPRLQRSTLSPPQLAAEQAKSGALLSSEQSRHFALLRNDEVAAANDYEGKGKAPKDYVAERFQLRYELDAPAAARLVDDCIAELLVVPLTLTSRLEGLFAQRPDGADLPLHGSQYTSEPGRMQEQVDLGALVGKTRHRATATAIGRPDDTFTRTRGPNYMRWRRDKDERESGYHGLSADDLPTYAAINPNFDVTKGGNANLATTDPGTGAISDAYGKNYYGDMHMVLRDAVRPRSTFIARGKKSVPGRRIERTGMEFLLADMCRLFMFDYVDAIVAGVSSAGTVLTNMDAEVHIYGKFDIATDVKAIYLQPAAYAANSGPGARVRAFARANGIALHDIGTEPPGFSVEAKQGIKGGIDLKSALAG